MSTFEPTDSPLRRLMSISWPLFRAFGVRVRLHWTTLLVPVFLWFGFSKWLPAGEAAGWTAAWFVLLYGVIWTHEMGHVWAGRSVGVETHEITLWPLGGLAHLQSGAPNPRSEVLIAVAGPLTHAVWFVLAGAPYFFFVQGSAAESGLWALMLKSFLGLNASLLFFNLLPFWPMDGGRVLRALLAMRLHPNHASLLAAYAGFAGSVILGLVGIAMMIQGGTSALLTDLGGPVLLSIGISNFGACRALLFEARWSEGPYRDASEPWRESLPETAWESGDRDDAEPVMAWRPRPRESEPGAAREKKAEAPRRREAARPARPLQERVDELLDRINEVGFDGLTDAERRELSDASERLKRGER